MAGNPLPIMCTLSPNKIVDRLAEFEALFAGNLTTVEREPLRLRLTFGNVSPARRQQIRGLFEAEQQCCAFLHFTYEVDGNELKVTVTAPTEAGPTLDGFQALAERNSSPHTVVQEWTER
ncbi:hypothetical protein ACFQ07_30965 [Actinomadura adrarensis]|uniref:Uncharacterized protein n=1 Tax=Actinomadura adrarensis TaxID=1819600 RepID=A0ABW3CQ85_9ACTN